MRVPGCGVFPWECWCLRWRVLQDHSVISHGFLGISGRHYRTGGHLFD